MVTNTFTLTVSEILYSAIGGSGFDFIELYNIGTVPLFLGSVRVLIDGIIISLSPPFFLHPPLSPPPSLSSLTPSSFLCDG